MNRIRHSLLAICLIVTCSIVSISESRAATAAELYADSNAALSQLYRQSPKAAQIGRGARAILVFPKIVKVGLAIGGQRGEGVLLVDGRPVGYYRISAASFGLQAGGQSFSYALFLMNDKALDYVKKNEWAIGSGPSVVVIDKGKAMTTNTTTLREDVYAVPFGQKGLMAGLGLEGSKIKQIKKG